MDTAPIKTALNAAAIKARVANIGYGARITVDTDQVDATLTACAGFFIHANPKFSYCTVSDTKSQIVVR